MKLNFIFPDSVLMKLTYWIVETTI